jgi:hypothetical protein
MSEACTLYGTVPFYVDEEFIEMRVDGIVNTIAEAGYATEVLDYIKVCGMHDKPMYHLLVAIPFDVYEDEDPDIVANEIVKDIIGETGIAIVLNEVLCG